MKKIIAIAMTLFLLLQIPQPLFADKGYKATNYAVKQAFRHLAIKRSKQIKMWKNENARIEKNKQKALQKIEDYKDGKIKLTPEQLQKCNQELIKKPRTPQEIIKEHKKKEKEKAREYRDKIGFWRWIGSKLFGEWVLYLDPPLQDLYFEDIVDMEDKEIEALYQKVNTYVPKCSTIKEKRDSLYELTAFDYLRRNETLLEKAWRDVGYSLGEANKMMKGSTSTPIPSSPIPIGF